MGFIGTRAELISKYGDFIKRQTRGTGIYPGTLITQLIVESQGKINGVYFVGGSSLSRNANNYFGIKADPGWKGAKYYIETREETPAGVSYTTKAAFRKYNSIEESIIDYINFLKSNPRYKAAGVFNAKSVEDQFQKLKEGGYATGTGYVQLLNSVYAPLKDQINSIRGGVDATKVLSFISAAALLYTFYDQFKRNYT